MVHQTLTTRLLAAHDFIEVAIAVCAVGRHELGLHQTVVTLQALDGRPLIMVDDIAKVTDDLRTAWMVDLWKRDPYLPIIRDSHAPAGHEYMTVEEVDRFTREQVGYRGDTCHMLLLPILQTGELLGSIRVGKLEPYTPELRRDLTMLSTHVSVRLAQLGITTLPCPLLAKLTPRQREVALVAARGHTNAEIALALELSENTVKKHLKDIFDMLEIANRTELAARLSTGPEHHVAIGVTRRGDVWITRGPPRGHDASSASAKWPSTSTQMPT
jgi:DNA-binding CsgD family transcriptional regulator